MTPNRETSTARDAPEIDGATQRLLDRAVSADDLAADAEWAARPTDAREAQTLGLLLFRLNDETAALPAALLRRVTPWARPTPIPHRSTRVLRGVCNIRGELVLCADLRQLLGAAGSTDQAKVGQADHDSRRMVVIGPADAPWVFEVDALIGYERIATSAIRPPPVTVEYAIGAFTTGIAEIRGERITVLDGERVLSNFRASLI